MIEVSVFKYYRLTDSCAELKTRACVRVDGPRPLASASTLGLTDGSPLVISYRCETSLLAEQSSLDFSANRTCTTPRIFEPRGRCLSLSKPDWAEGDVEGDSFGPI